MYKGTYTNIYLRGFGYWSYNNQSFNSNIDHLFIANNVTTISITPNSGSADVTDYAGTSRLTNNSQISFSITNLYNMDGKRIRIISLTISNCSGPNKWAIGCFTTTANMVLS